jgi:transcriptional regulator with XRE-family HTH domain
MPANWRQRGLRIKQLREDRHWTQETLAKKAHVSRVTIGRIEIGHSRPSLELLERLAKILKVTVSQLLE